MKEGRPAPLERHAQSPQGSDDGGSQARWVALRRKIELEHITSVARVKPTVSRFHMVSYSVEVLAEEGPAEVETATS